VDQGLCWALYISLQLLLRTTQTDNSLHVKWRRKWTKGKQTAPLSQICHFDNRELFMVSCMFHTFTHTSPIALYLRPSTSLKKPSLTAPPKFQAGASLFFGASQPCFPSVTVLIPLYCPCLSPLLDHELLEGRVLSKPQVPSTGSGKY